MVDNIHPTHISSIIDGLKEITSPIIFIAFACGLSILCTVVYQMITVSGFHVFSTIGIGKLKVQYIRQIEMNIQDVIHLMN